MTTFQRIAFLYLFFVSFYASANTSYKTDVTGFIFSTPLSDRSNNFSSTKQSKTEDASYFTQPIRPALYGGNTLCRGRELHSYQFPKGMVVCGAGNSKGNGGNSKGSGKNRDSSSKQKGQITLAGKFVTSKGRGQSGAGGDGQPPQRPTSYTRDSAHQYETVELPSQKKKKKKSAVSAQPDSASPSLDSTDNSVGLYTFIGAESEDETQTEVSDPVYAQLRGKVVKNGVSLAVDRDHHTEPTESSIPPAPKRTYEVKDTPAQESPNAVTVPDQQMASSDISLQDEFIYMSLPDSNDDPEECDAKMFVFNLDKNIKKMSARIRPKIQAFTNSWRPHKSKLLAYIKGEKNHEAQSMADSCKQYYQSVMRNILVDEGVSENDIIDILTTSKYIDPIILKLISAYQPEGYAVVSGTTIVARTLAECIVLYHIVEGREKLNQAERKIVELHISSLCPIIRESFNKRGIMSVEFESLVINQGSQYFLEFFFTFFKDNIKDFFRSLMLNEQAFSQ